MDFNSFSPVLAANSATSFSSEPQCGSLPDGLSALPAGFPSQVDHAMAWVGNPGEHEIPFLYMLSASDKAEIASALAHFNDLLSRAALRRAAPVSVAAAAPDPELLHRGLERARADGGEARAQQICAEL